MIVNCPKCGKTLDATGRAPGSSIACGSCGNVTAAPATPPRSKKGLYIALAVVGVFLGCPGILAAIAIPNFIRFQSRAKQVECKTNLKSWYVGQRSLGQGYSLAVEEVGFRPERGNRYAYFAGPGPIVDRSAMEAQPVPEAVGYGVDTFKHSGARPLTLENLPPEVARSVGMSGECPDGGDCAITMACAGNVDRDDTLDVWSVSTAERIGAGGERYAPGEVVHHVDDLKD